MIDAHLHLQMPVFRDRIDGVLETTRELGITTLVVNGTGPGDWGEVAALAERYSEVFPFFGLHPWQVREVEPGWERYLREFLESFPSAGVGEVGLDKWIRDPDVERQKSALFIQLELARELDRPVTIHCLQAWGHLRECLRESPFDGSFLIHSFGGPVEMIDDFVDRGAFFSLSGYFFRPDKTRKLEAFSHVPEDRILLETDAPDMLPPPERIRFPMRSDEGEANHPGNLVEVYEAFAEWSGESPLVVEERIRENFASWIGRERP